MPIPFTTYVEITSSVGGAASAQNRELIVRLVTTNPLIPTGSVVEFTSAAAVGVYFGTTSVEFLQAQFYFGFVTVQSTKPEKISFARWAQDDVAATVTGETAARVLGSFTSITDGAMTVTLGADVEVITGMNFTSAASLADVATVVGDAIIAANVTASFASSVTTFNATDSRFDFVAGITGALILDITPGGSGTEVAPLIGWLQPFARFSDGRDAETLTSILTETTELSNNFGSFSFIPSTDLVLADNLEVATWNDGENISFMYLEKILAADAQANFDSLQTLSGTAVTLYDPVAFPNEYPWLAPGALFAATPYFKRAGVQAYMYQTFSLSATVKTEANRAIYDPIKVNYYGETQTAGQLLSFYQRGNMLGLATDPLAMGVYANEAFLKDSIAVSILNLLISQPVVPANERGIGMVLAMVQANIDGALFNGTISIGKALNATQKAFIQTTTGSDVAYLQIESIGYWIDAEIQEPEPGEFQIVYTLIYSKNDAVRKVEGSHLLT